MGSRPHDKIARIPFTLESNFELSGDQSQAVKALNEGLSSGVPFQTLLGVTGSGKTFSIANVIRDQGRPTLIIAPNKTLAAQLYSEFCEFFPQDRVRLFVSYYDYYQPEAYVPSSDTFIEKDASINEEIDKLRHSATRAVLEGTNTIVVASVSCIYGLGSPDDYFQMMLFLEKGEEIEREEVLRSLVHMQFERSDFEFKRGTFRVRGETIDIFPADQDSQAYRLLFFGDEIEAIEEIDSLTGAKIAEVQMATVYPVSHFVTEQEVIHKARKTIKAELQEWIPELEKQGKHLEAQRLEQRTMYDLELMAELGFCPGIENYSRHIDGRSAGSAPATLLDYFPDDMLLVIDESHVTVPQIGGMYKGDQARKKNLVEYGFRLPSALDNRPLSPDEFWQKVQQAIFVSATPGDFEMEKSEGVVVEQVNRPTGLLDPAIDIRPATNQVDDLIEEIKTTIEKGERILAITLTKRMAEDLAEYLREIGVACRYLHSDVKTIERVEILRGLRRGDFDVLIGINLLREGLDLVEVSLVAILDADKEGFLRSTRSLIQTMGRAARNVNGRAILYADKVTRSMQEAIDETNRRREIQAAYNEEHGIVPRTVERAEQSSIAAAKEDQSVELTIDGELLEIPEDPKQQQATIDKLQKQMFEAAGKRDFEQAAQLRDIIQEIQQELLKR